MKGDGDIDDAGHPTMKQFGFDSIGNIADRLGSDIRAEMIAAMYNSDNFGLNIKFGTQYKFDSDSITKDNANGFAAGFDTLFIPSAMPDLKIFASAMGTVNWGVDANPDPIMGGARIGYNLALNDDISLEPWAGVDARIRVKDSGDMEKPGYEASFGATMRWPGQGGWLKDYIINSDGRVFPGMSIGYKIYEEKEDNLGLEHSIKFTLFEPRGDEGLFYKLGSEIIVDIIDLTNVTEGKAATEVNPAGGFKILATAYFDLELSNIGKIPGSFIPWTILYYDNLPDGGNRINDFKIDFGINLENAIANTVFGVAWNTGSLIQKSTDGHKLGFLRFIAEIRL
jgi:hypothetical protein